MSSYPLYDETGKTNLVNFFGDKVQCGDYAISNLMETLNGDTERLSDQQRNPDTWKVDNRDEYIRACLEKNTQAPIVIIEKGDKLSIHDGGHRDYTIRTFMNGEFGVTIETKPFGDVKYYYVENKGNIKEIQTYRKLGKKIHIFSDIEKRKFKMNQIPVVIYRNLTEDEEVLVFGRWNSGLPISNGERMKAMKRTPLHTVVMNYYDSTWKDIAYDIVNCRSFDRHAGLLQLSCLIIPHFSSKPDGVELTQTGADSLSKYSSLCGQEHTEDLLQKIKTQLETLANIMKCCSSKNPKLPFREVMAISTIITHFPSELARLSQEKMENIVKCFFIKCGSSKNLQSKPDWLKLWTIEGVKSTSNTGGPSNIRKMREGFTLWFKSLDEQTLERIISNTNVPKPQPKRRRHVSSSS